MKQTMKKISTVFLPAVLGLFLFSTVASAHVTVAPKQSTAGAWETYTVKVPAEKNIPTTKITLKTPQGVELESYQPVPGWSYSADKDANGKIKSFSFQTTGEGILPGQFQQFSFVAKNPDKTGQIVWDAFQYYKDGSIVEWTGDESAPTPHAITDIVSSAAANQPAAQSPAKQNNTAKTAAATGSSPSSPLAIILSVIALILSLAALVVSIRKR